MSREVVAIVNPASGRRKMMSIVHEVGRLVAAHHWKLIVATTRGPHHATDLARRWSARPDTRAILVVGGDGTSGEVINGLTDHDVPLVILPTGTENLLAREVGASRDPVAIAEALVSGQARPLDLGVVNGRRFASIVGIGFDGECVRRLAGRRMGHITHFDYLWPVWRSFWEYALPHIEIEADGEPVFSGRGLAFIGNIGRYSLGLRILKRARYDDGLLDLCVLPCDSRRALVGEAFQVLRGTHIEQPGTVYRQCRTVRVHGADAPVPIEVDGDVGGHLPVSVSVAPGAVRLAVTCRPGHAGERFPAFGD